jgi:hypothetical protein
MASYEEGLDDGVVSTMPPKEAVPEPVAPAPVVEAAAEEPVVEAVAEPESPAEPIAEPETKKAPMPSWLKDRLAEESGKRHEAQRVAEEARKQNEVLQATIEALRKGQAPVEGVVPPLPQPGYVPESEIERRAVSIAAQRAHDEACNKAVDDGKAAYKDFETAMEPLRMIGAVNSHEFREAALATGAPADVLYYLGNNPDQAAAIYRDMQSGQSSRGVAAMTRIAMEVAAKKAAPRVVSKAPAPIKPVGGSATPVVDLEKMPMDDFSGEFDKKAAARGWY